MSQFDNICEVQSDKASVTITSRYDGTIKTLRYQVDDVARVGSALLDIEVEAEDGNCPQATDKCQGDAAGKTLLETNESSSSSDKAMQDEKEYERTKSLATPAVRKIAMENNIDLSEMRGSGKNGRIMKEDILAILGKTRESTSQLPIELKAESKVYDKYMWKSMTKSLVSISFYFFCLSLDNVCFLFFFLQSIPHFVYSDECDVSKLTRCRQELNETLRQTEAKSLTFLAFFVKATSLALERVPILNGILDEDNQAVRTVERHNISVAIDAPQGLVVPNIKDVRSKNVIEIADELKRLQQAAQSTTLSLKDLSDGTFTLSNVGTVFIHWSIYTHIQCFSKSQITFTIGICIFLFCLTLQIGGTYTKPVIMPPQVAIGAIGRVQRLPRFDKDDNVVAAHIINVSWSADHRVINGATVAIFSNHFKHYLENPALLLLHS